MGIKKYQQLIGKTIDVESLGMVMNSFTITAMEATVKTLAERGEVYKCAIDWANKDLPGAHEALDFDEQTLNDLLMKNEAHNPGPVPVSFKFREPLRSTVN